MRIEKYMLSRSFRFAYGDPAKRESKSTSFTLSGPCALWRPPFWGKTRRPPPTPRGLLIPAASPSGAISDSPSGASGQSLPGNSGRPPGASGQPLRGNSVQPLRGNSGLLRDSQGFWFSRSGTAHANQLQSGPQRPRLGRKLKKPRVNPVPTFMLENPA